MKGFGPGETQVALGNFHSSKVFGMLQMSPSSGEKKRKLSDFRKNHPFWVKFLSKFLRVTYHNPRQYFFWILSKFPHNFGQQIIKKILILFIFQAL
jgi:hypothetical protein